MNVSRCRGSLSSRDFARGDIRWRGLLPARASSRGLARNDTPTRVEELPQDGRVLQPPGLPVLQKFGGAKSGRLGDSVAQGPRSERVHSRRALDALVAEAPVVPQPENASLRAILAAGDSAGALSKAEPKKNQQLTEAVLSS